MPLAGWTCLLVLLCLTVGCWGSHSKQEAADQPAAKQSDVESSGRQRLPKAAESSSTKRAATDAPADELGFKRTWKPKVVPPAKTSVSASAVAARPEDEDNRYADLLPAPTVGKKAELPPSPAVGHPATEPAANGGSIQHAALDDRAPLGT